MRTTIHNFLEDEQGFIVSAELVLVATILILGLVVGLSSLQTAIVSELNNVAAAFCSLNQGYFLPGFFGCRGAMTYGSVYYDNFMCLNCLAGGAGGFGGTGFGGAGFGGGAFGAPVGISTMGLEGGGAF